MTLLDPVSIAHTSLIFIDVAIAAALGPIAFPLHFVLMLPHLIVTGMGLANRTTRVGYIPWAILFLAVNTPYLLLRIIWEYDPSGNGSPIWVGSLIFFWSLFGLPFLIPITVCVAGWQFFYGPGDETPTLRWLLPTAALLTILQSLATVAVMIESIPEG